VSRVEPDLNDWINQLVSQLQATANVLRSAALLAGGAHVVPLLAKADEADDLIHRVVEDLDLE